MNDNDIFSDAIGEVYINESSTRQPGSMATNDPNFVELASVASASAGSASVNAATTTSTNATGNGLSSTRRAICNDFSGHLGVATRSASQSDMEHSNNSGIDAIDAEQDAYWQHWSDELWDGFGKRDDEFQLECLCCGVDIEACSCAECGDCRTVGNPDCYVNGGAGCW